MSNAIAIARNLAASGLTREQAEAIAEVVVTHADESHATKADIAEARAELKADIAEARAEFKADITEIKTDIAELKASVRFLFWAVGAVIVVNLATLALVANLLLKVSTITN